MSLNKVHADLNGSMLAMLHDDMQSLIYVTVSSHSKRRPKKPDYISDKIIHGEQKQAEYQGYESSEDYEEAWARITGHAHVETR